MAWVGAKLLEPNYGKQKSRLTVGFFVFAKNPELLLGGFCCRGRRRRCRRCGFRSGSWCDRFSSRCRGWSRCGCGSRCRGGSRCFRFATSGQRQGQQSNNQSRTFHFSSFINFRVQKPEQEHTNQIRRHVAAAKRRHSTNYFKKYQSLLNQTVFLPVVARVCATGAARDKELESGHPAQS